jgi:hypothetical protein
MRVWLILVAVAGCVVPICAGQSDFASPSEFNPLLFKQATWRIDPDSSVYGLPFGATIDSLVARFGRPNGVVRIDDIRTGYIYGHTHLFVMKSGALREVYLGLQVLDWTIAKKMEQHPFFDNGDWTVKPGIRANMRFEEVATLLGNRIGSPDYEKSFTTNQALVRLRFSSADNGKTFTLSSVMIRHY